MSEQQKNEGCFCCGTGPRLSQMFGSCWSESTKQHFRASSVEFWKGMRSLIDEHINRMSSQGQKGSSVPVE